MAQGIEKPFLCIELGRGSKSSLSWFHFHSGARPAVEHQPVFMLTMSKTTPRSGQAKGSL